MLAAAGLLDGRAWSGQELAIDPGDPLFDPAFHPGDFVAIGARSAIIICVAEAEVPIPNWFELEFAAAIFVEENAVAKAIDVFGHLDEPMLVDERIDIEKGAIAAGGVHEIGPVKGCFKAI